MNEPASFLMKVILIVLRCVLDCSCVKVIRAAPQCHRAKCEECCFQVMDVERATLLLTKLFSTEGLVP